MILRRIARPSAVAKSVEQISRPSTLIPQQQTRSIHARPPLGNSANDRGEYFGKHGVPGFLSPLVYRQTWVDYQDHLVEEINKKVEGTEWANKSAYQMHVELSRRPDYADFYNYAAMAHFNHVWWEGISDVKTQIPEPLTRDIEEIFSSVDQLRFEMLECADAMFGNGFVWLMKEKAQGHQQHTNLRLLCTYNAGSPYSKAWRMRQNVDMHTRRDPSSIFGRDAMSTPQNRVAMDRYVAGTTMDKDRAPNTLISHPLLCLNVWQHMWIPDYGILGRRKYLAAWWERIDWSVVYRRYTSVVTTDL